MEPTLNDILRRRETLQSIMGEALQDIQCHEPLEATGLSLCGDCVIDYDHLVVSKCKLAQDNLKLYLLAKSKLEEHIRENDDFNERQGDDEIHEMNAEVDENRIILDSLESE